MQLELQLQSNHSFFANIIENLQMQSSKFCLEVHINDDKKCQSPRIFNIAGENYHQSISVKPVATVASKI